MVVAELPMLNLEGVPDVEQIKLEKFRKKNYEKLVLNFYFLVNSNKTIMLPMMVYLDIRRARSKTFSVIFSLQTLGFSNTLKLKRRGTWSVEGSKGC